LTFFFFFLTGFLVLLLLGFLVEAGFTELFSDGLTVAFLVGVGLVVGFGEGEAA
jgi:hypothetical protein